MPRYGTANTNAYGVEQDCPTDSMAIATTRPTPQSGWTLWQEAIAKSIPTCSTTKPIYPLGVWTDSLKDWKWQWNPLENRLAEFTEKGWQIWLPMRWSQSNWLKCPPTDLYTLLNPQFQQAVVEILDHQVFFQGSRWPTSKMTLMYRLCNLNCQPGVCKLGFCLV